MKNIAVLILCCNLIHLLACKDKLSNDPMVRPYFSMETSIKKKTFVEELKPQQSYIEIEGHKHFIKASWIEHPHYETNSEEIICKNVYCFLMEFEYNSNINIDLSDYIKELGNGSTTVWYFLPKGNEKTSIFKLKYRSSIGNEKRDKYFLVYRR